MTEDESVVDQDFTALSVTLFVLEIVIFFFCLFAFCCYEIFRLVNCIVSLKKQKNVTNDLINSIIVVVKEKLKKKSEEGADGDYEENEKDDENEIELGEGNIFHKIDSEKGTDVFSEDDELQEGGNEEIDEKNSSEEDFVKEKPYNIGDNKPEDLENNNNNNIDIFVPREYNLSTPYDDNEEDYLDDDSSTEKKKEEEDDDDEEKNQKGVRTEYILFEGYGMNTIIFLSKYPPYISTLVMLFIRLFFVTFNLTFLIYGLVSYQINEDKLFFAHFQHLTIMSYSILTFYSVISTVYTAIVFTLLFIAKPGFCDWFDPKKPDFPFVYFEYIVRLFFGTAFISAHVTTVAFWFLGVPVVSASIGNFKIDPTTFPMHGVNSLFMLIEILLLYKVHFPPCLCWWVGAYPWFYLIVVTIFVKSKFIDELPYEGLMSVDKNVYSIFLRIFIGLTFPVLALVFSGCLWLRDLCFWGCNEVKGRKDLKKRESDNGDR